MTSVLPRDLLAHATDEELEWYVQHLAVEADVDLGDDGPWTLQDRQQVAEDALVGLDPTMSHELLYGGAAGPGKSEWLLWHLYDKALRYPGFRALFLRRTYPELRRSAIIRSLERFDRAKARYVITESTWKFKNGSFIEFGYCESDTDVYQYQSAEYDCVEGDTPIVMGDGTHKPISEVRVGDFVATLEGPRVVERVQAVGIRPSVRVETPTATVVTSYGHRVLDASGHWQTPMELQPSARRPVGTMPATYLASHRGASTLRAYSPSGFPREHVRDGRATLVAALRRSAASSTRPGNGDTESSARPRALPPPRSWTAHLTLYEPSRYREESSCASGSRQHGMFHAPTGPAPQGFPGGYPAGCRCDDARSRREEGADRARTPSQADVDAAASMPGSLDDRVRTRTRIPGSHTYRHPYTMEERPLLAGVRRACVRISPAGDRVLWDMTVSGASHYISRGGVIHSNCVAWDELTQWPTDKAYKYLFSRCRSRMSLLARGFVPHIIAATNPGGVGGGWVKARFVDKGPPEERTTHALELPGTRADVYGTRIFIPGLLSDNKYINQDSYVAMLANMDEDLVLALLEGSWDVIEGQYFPEWNKHVHVVKPFELPSWWSRVGGVDYGYAKPWCSLEAAFDQDGIGYVYREHYDVGLVPSQQCKTIKDALQANEKISYRVGDPSMWASTGVGMAVASQYVQFGVPLHKAKNARVAGWSRVREYLRIVEDDRGKPASGLHIFENCHNLIRTLPMLVRDQKNPEDCNTDGEDHAPDALRYLLMARPPRSRTPKLEGRTLEERLEKRRRERERARRGDRVSSHPVIGDF